MRPAVKVFIEWLLFRHRAASITGSFNLQYLPSATVRPFAAQISPGNQSIKAQSNSAASAYTTVQCATNSVAPVGWVAF